MVLLELGLHLMSWYDIFMMRYFCQTLHYNCIKYDTLPDIKLDIKLKYSYFNNTYMGRIQYHGNAYCNCQFSDHVRPRIQ